MINYATGGKVMAVKEKGEYTLEEAKRIADGYDAISFDIFDTLVMRKVYFNHDVFRMVGRKYERQIPNFFELRTEAERELTKDGYPFIEEIYNRVAEKSGIDDKLKTEIMQYEIETERHVIVPRFSVIELFNYCKQTGKKVSIVSDMYMHKPEIEDIIKKMGIDGYYRIFVSSEYDTSKPQHLFEEYKKEVVASSYLHIGDSYACDVEPSQRANIDCFRIEPSSEIYEKMGNRPSEDFEERVRQAEYIATWLNSPFLETASAV